MNFKTSENKDLFFVGKYDALKFNFLCSIAMHWMVNHFNAKEPILIERKNTNQIMISFFMPYSSKYKRKQTLLNATETKIFWIRLILM